MSDTKNVSDWYNKNADYYAGHSKDPSGSQRRVLYERPAMYALLPDLVGRDVLNLGCGGGDESNYFKELGARKSIGIDISTGLLTIAKESYPHCEFNEMDMEHLSFADGSFDFVYSSLAIHYNESWLKTLSEAFRVLKPESYFLFSCGHPVHYAMSKTETEKTSRSELSVTKDVETNKVTVVGDYLTPKPVTHTTIKAPTWHRPIGDISKEIMQSGFVIEQIVEPRPLEKMKERALDYY